MKDVKKSKEEIKLSLLVDMIVYIESLILTVELTKFRKNAEF